MPNEGGSPYTKARTYRYLFVLAVVLAAIAWLGLGRSGEEERAWTWLWVLGLLTAFAFITGRAITGLWRGILIDSRYRMSLARLQLLTWSLLVLSALLTAVLSNTGMGGASPMNIDIPSQLWVAMGISTGSLVAAPAILSTKRNKKPDPAEHARTVAALGDQAVYAEPESLLVRHTHPKEARWGDLLKGEESGNADTVDLGKVQMFLFTFILVLGYAAGLGAMFQEAGPIVALPAVDEGMNTLLGISHTGYLANKAVSHSREAPSAGSGAAGG